MDAEDRRSRSKRTSRLRTKALTEDAEADNSNGSFDNSTESSFNLTEEQQAASEDGASVSGSLSSKPSRAPSSEKRCGFCWRGKKSSLGQGVLVRCEPTAGFNPFKRALKGRAGSLENDPNIKRRNRGDQSKSPKRSGATAGRSTPTTRDERLADVEPLGSPYYNVYCELSEIGLPADVTPHDIFDEDRAVWAHHCCAAWCECVLQAEDYSLQFVDKAAINGLNTRCSHCGNYGATIQCKAQRCTKKFHYPCASGSGCFQDIKTLTLLCTDHADMAASIAGAEAQCVVCNDPGDLLKQLFCTSCGQHYHSDCLEPEVDTHSVVRAGWQCPECKLCQECRKPGDNTKILDCDVCDKGFHTYCLNPSVKQIPNTWKCESCRVCTECGGTSRTLAPKDGTILKWHKNHTLCDICHTKPPPPAKPSKPVHACPMCRRTYTLNLLKGLTQCTACKRYIHHTCDPLTLEAERGKFRCFECVTPVYSDTSTLVDTPTGSTRSADVTPAACGPGDMDEDISSEPSASTDAKPVPSRVRTKTGKGKPSSFSRNRQSASKKPTPKSLPISRKAGGVAMKKRSRVSAVERRKTRTKAKQALSPINYNTGPGSDISKCLKQTDEDDQHAAVVLTAAADEFVLSQDMCISCGSFGKDPEGNLIVCSQCGQCYHPFCAQSKLNKVVLTKGWRCLDCTVCEGCGKPSDEPNLLLCDECDISYHIYCLDPPLTTVPKGNWKCKWCVRCKYCGSTSPGFGCDWIDNYTECAPCHSVTDCPICEQCYMDNELVVQCLQCERWLHATCDNMTTEEEAERMSDLGYNCPLCRVETGVASPRTAQLPPIPPEKEEEELKEEPEKPPEPKSYLVDGVCLSEAGICQVKELVINPLPPPSTPKPPLARQKSHQRNQKIKQSHPQMSHLLSQTSNISEAGPDDETTMVERLCGPPSVAPSHSSDHTVPDTAVSVAISDTVMSPLSETRGDALLDPPLVVTSLMESESTEATRSELVDSVDLPEGSAAGVGAAEKKKRTRKQTPIGMGGFVARVRIRAPPKLLVHGPHEADGTPPRPPTPSESAESQKKKQRKKTVIEDTYPAYLQEAFFGKEALDSKSEPEFEPESQASLSTDIPQHSLITLPEGTEIPGSGKPTTSDLDQIVPMDLGETSKTIQDDNTLVGDTDDLKDILPDILPSALRDDEFLKIFEMEEGERAGPSAPDSSTPLVVSGAAPDDAAHEVEVMDLDHENLEDFLKGMLESDEVLSSHAAELPDMHNSGAMSGLDTRPHNIQQQPPHVQQHQQHPPQIQHQQPSNNSIPQSQMSLQSQNQAPTNIHGQSQSGMQLQSQPQPTMTLHGQNPAQMSLQSQSHSTMAMQGQNQPPMSIQAQNQGIISMQAQGPPPMSIRAQQHPSLQRQPPMPPMQSAPQPQMGPMQPQMGPIHPGSSMPMSHGGIVTGPAPFQLGTPPGTHSGHPAFERQISLPAPGIFGAHGQQNLGPGSATPLGGLGNATPLARPGSATPLGGPGSAPPTPFSPTGKFEEPNWNAAMGGPESDDPEHLSLNKRNMLKWKDDEPLGLEATISPVLFANTQHPELKQQYPDWPERCKQIAKLWRKLSSDQRSPYLQKARENRQRRSTKRKKERRAKDSPSTGGTGGASSATTSPLQSPRPGASPRRTPGGSNENTTESKLKTEPPFPGQPSLLPQGTSSGPELQAGHFNPQQQQAQPQAYRPEMFGGPQPPMSQAVPMYGGVPQPSSSQPGHPTSLPVGSSMGGPSGGVGGANAAHPHSTLAGLAMSTDDASRAPLLTPTSTSTSRDLPSEPQQFSRSWSSSSVRHPAHAAYSAASPTIPSGYSEEWTRPRGIISPSHPSSANSAAGIRSQMIPRRHHEELWRMNATPRHPGIQHRMPVGAEIYQRSMSMPAFAPPVSTTDHVSGGAHPGGSPGAQEALDDLLGDSDGHFEGLLNLQDPLLDETLSDFHDKNIFDEHLGLISMEESQQAPPAEVVKPVASRAAPLPGPGSTPATVNSSPHQSKVNSPQISMDQTITPHLAASPRTQTAASPHPSIGGSPHPVGSSSNMPTGSPFPVVNSPRMMVPSSPRPQHYPGVMGSPHRVHAVQSPAMMDSRPFSRQGSIQGELAPGGPPTPGTPLAGPPGAMYGRPPSGPRLSTPDGRSPYAGGAPPPSPYMHPVGSVPPPSEGQRSDPLQDMLEEERRLQISSQGLQKSTSATELDSHMKVEAGPSREGVSSSPHIGGDFQPPPPPYPGTGRVTPGHVPHPHAQLGHAQSALPQSPAHPGIPHHPVRFPVAQQGVPTGHRSPIGGAPPGAVPGVPSQSPGVMLGAPLRMPEMTPEQLQHKEWLNHREVEITNHLQSMEKELTAAKKLKKQLVNRQKALKKNNEDLQPPDLEKLSRVTADIPIIVRNVEAIKSDHKHHQQLQQKFKAKVQHQAMIGWGGPPRGYPPGMHPFHRMRGPLPPGTRMIDPRQAREYEIYRMQMVRQRGINPSMQAVHRQYYPEGESSGGPDEEERRRHYMRMQHHAAMSGQMSGQRMMNPEMAARFQPQQQHRFPQPGQPMKSEGEGMRPSGPRMRMPAPQADQPKQGAANAEKPSPAPEVPVAQLHMGAVPLSFPGQRLLPTPGAIVSAKPYVASTVTSSAQTKTSTTGAIARPTPLNEVPKEAMVALGNQYPLELVKREPVITPGVIPGQAAANSDSITSIAPEPAPPPVTDADGTTLEERISATINAVAEAAREAVQAEERAAAALGLALPEPQPTEARSCELSAQHKADLMAALGVNSEDGFAEALLPSESQTRLATTGESSTSLASIDTSQPEPSAEHCTTEPTGTTEPISQPSEKPQDEISAQTTEGEVETRREHAEGSTADPTTASADAAANPAAAADAVAVNAASTAAAATPIKGDEDKKPLIEDREGIKSTEGVERNESEKNAEDGVKMKTEPTIEAQSSISGSSTSQHPVSYPSSSQPEQTKPAFSTESQPLFAALPASTIQSSTTPTFLSNYVQQSSNAGSVALKQLLFAPDASLAPPTTTQPITEQMQVSSAPDAATSLASALSTPSTSFHPIEEQSSAAAMSMASSQQAPPPHPQFNQLPWVAEYGIPVEVWNKMPPKEQQHIYDMRRQIGRPPLAPPHHNGPPGHSGSIRGAFTPAPGYNPQPERMGQIGNPRIANPQIGNPQIGNPQIGNPQIVRPRTQAQIRASHPGVIRHSAACGPSTSSTGPAQATALSAPSVTREGTTPTATTAATQSPAKKKKQPAERKRKPKTSSSSTALTTPPAQTTPTPNLTEPLKMLETVTKNMRNLQPIELREPELSAVKYTQPIQPTRTTNTGRVSTPKHIDKLHGSFGRSVIDGKFDVYSHAPFSNVPLPASKLQQLQISEASNRKGSSAAASVSKDSTTSGAASTASTPSYDISRFQTAMRKTTPAELPMPSPPNLVEPWRPVADSPISMISCPSPMSEAPPTSLATTDTLLVMDKQSSLTTEKERMNELFPFLTTIKDEAIETSTCNMRASPDLPVYTPAPIKYFGSQTAATADVKSECSAPSILPPANPFASVPEDELKSTAVGIQSSLQSAIRQSPSQQVSVTLTLSSEAAQDIPNVLSALADLLRMAAPSSYSTQYTDGPSPLGGGEMLMGDVDRPSICVQCSSVVQIHSGVKILAPPSLSDKIQPGKPPGELTFCGSECHFQYMTSHPAALLTPSLKHGGDLATPTSQDYASPSTEIPKPPDAPSKTGNSKSVVGKKKRQKQEPPAKPIKKWKGTRWRYWDIKVTFNLHKYEPTTEQDVIKTIKMIKQTVKPEPMPEDTRVCILCCKNGDETPGCASRLLNYEVDKWIHLNCALWSNEVYETLNGSLVNVDVCVKRARELVCSSCATPGAGLTCFRQRCTNQYHVACALQAGVQFFPDKSVLCPIHVNKESTDQLSELTVRRKVFVSRDEPAQIANAIRHDEVQCSVRIGALVYYSVGQLFNHQALTGRFHTRDFIFPVGYKCVRFFWSIRHPNKRCQYVCTIRDMGGAPQFIITIREKGHTDQVLRGESCKAVWDPILSTIERQRAVGDYVKIFPQYLSGEYLFGLKEPAIIRIIESLPGVEFLAGYALKYGKTQLIEMPPAINPTGSARSEPKLRTHFRKPHTLQTSSRSHLLPSMTIALQGADANSPYHKQFIHSKSQQYKKLKKEWSNYVYLGRSRIQGLGMFAARDIEKHTMVIEYIGEIIRNELAEFREKIYDSHNRGVYMFRITPDYVIDATMAGGPARYINHSCAPNCVAETVTMDKEVKIVIIALRRINKGEELNYDYKFDLEDDSSKIPCNCGAPNCRKWMN